MLVQMRAVKLDKAVTVLGKMRRHPIHDNADAGLMKFVNHIAEIVRIAETRSRREHAGNLIPPGSVQRMFGQRQKLDMRKAHVADIGDKIVGKLAVSQIFFAMFALAAPGTEMNLVNGHRTVETVGLLAVVHPVFVFPMIIFDVVNDRCRIRPFFGIKSNRIRLNQYVVLLGFDFVFVKFALPDAGNENIPDAAGRMFAHNVDTSVPIVEAADDGNTLGIRRPDGKTYAGHAVHRHRMRTEFFIHVKMGAFGKEIGVDVADIRLKTIGIFGHIGIAQVVFDFETIGEIFPDAEVNLIEAAIIKFGHHPQRRAVVFQDLD